jgi:hypothetical protein
MSSVANGAVNGNAANTTNHTAHTPVTVARRQVRRQFDRTALMDYSPVRLR